MVVVDSNCSGQVVGLVGSNPLVVGPGCNLGVVGSLVVVGEHNL